MPLALHMQNPTKNRALMFLFLWRKYLNWLSLIIYIYLNLSTGLYLCLLSYRRFSCWPRGAWEPIAFGYLLVISRLKGKSVMPSKASCDGLIHCCDHNEIRDTLISAIDQMDTIQLCIMAWPNQTRPFNTNFQPIGASSLRPPTGTGCIFFPDTWPLQQILNVILIYSNQLEERGETL